MKTPAYPSVDSRRDVWASHLREIFQALNIPSGPQAEHLAESVAMVCRRYYPRGLPSSDLKLLVARALCAVGDHPAARRVLESMEPHRRHAARWLEILSELHHFPELLPYFSLGVIRPADWAGARLDRMWTLDFGRLAVADGERHEMMLYRSVRVLVEAMSVFWDATGGEGILGLKNLSAMTIRGKNEGERSPAASADLLQYIGDLFARQKVSRQWHATPSLLNLDL